MVFSDLQLARRVEAAEAANARGCTAIHAEAAALEVGGGCAVFVGAASPLSRAVGIGLNGPVSEAEIDQLEAFYRSRGGKAVILDCTEAFRKPVSDHPNPQLRDALKDSDVAVRRYAAKALEQLRTK